MNGTPSTTENDIHGATEDLSIMNVTDPPTSNMAPSVSATTTLTGSPVGNKLCDKCGLPMSGQFVRALAGTYHLDCFRCHDCDRTVASKFFPIDHPERTGQQLPLCETDYFRRLDLLCHNCGEALRGSYITAIEKKFHIEHFTCSICPTVFGPQDSYYEHEGDVYCHYHFSLQFAQKCYGCQTSILKQFVEILRNGQNQHWHPECYMIQKFWNVKLASRSEEEQNIREFAGLSAEEVRQREALMEEKVNHIWNVLSGFEESSAACISDMLLNVSNGAYIDGVLAAVKFIAHVEVLFAALDRLETALVQSSGKGLPYGREAKMLCKKIVAFFHLLSKTQDVGVRKLGITQELLSLVTGLAHYLKLLIRISLTGSLKLERDRTSTTAVKTYLTQLDSLNRDAVEHAMPTPPEGGTNLAVTGVKGQLASFADTCKACNTPLEEECVKTGTFRFHLHCMKCLHCQRPLQAEYFDASYNRSSGEITCAQCATPGSQEGFVYVTRLTQYVYLLRSALARLYGTLREGPLLPHTSGKSIPPRMSSVADETADDPNLQRYDSEDRDVGVDGNDGRPDVLTPSSRSKSFSNDGAPQENSNTYATTLNDIRRLRSTHMQRTLSNQPLKPRRSRVLDTPESEDNINASGNSASPKAQAPRELRIEEESVPQAEPENSFHLKNDRSITFDDLNRLVASEKSKQKRPRSFLKKARPRSPKKSVDNQRLTSSSHGDLTRPEYGRREALPSNDSSLSLQMRAKTYFSELSALEVFIVRHIAVMSLEPLVNDHFNMEELLDLIETRKGGFWGKFGKAFKPPKEKAAKERDEKKGARKRIVFGVALDTLVDRNSAESTLGVGPQPLRVPGFVDDVLVAMKGMDMSVEGVFRKNGNIRRLKELADSLDKNAGTVNLTEENAVQLAALLKKFLRDLPDPLMTFKLHKLFVIAQKYEDEDIRYRIMHLTCCLLPKAHRDTMEVVFTFFTWVAQFAHIDDESGSKMDEHNLATVVTPNVLYSKNKEPGMDESFAAIETVHAMIKYSEEFSCVPEDLLLILQDTTLFSNSADLTTKDILKRCEDKLNSKTASSSKTVEAITRRPTDRPKPPTRVDTDAAQVWASDHEASVAYRGGGGVGGTINPSSSTSLPLDPSPRRRDNRRPGGRSVSDKDAERVMHVH